MKNSKLSRLLLAAMLLALAQVLPFLTGQVPQIGNLLCPMHIPVLLCGYLCGIWYGLAVGFLAPLLRFVLFGAPPIMPIGIAMCFELATYGGVSALLYRVLPGKKRYLYVSLIGAMVVGRIVWGLVRGILYGLGKAPFGWPAFLAGAVTNAIPGIVLQLVLIPILMMTRSKVAK